MRCGGRVAARLEPLERQREVRAALGRHERVDLVDDDRVDRAQRLARVRRQQQIERLRRGDQDVGRLALEARALGCRRVAGADGDRRRRRSASPRAVGDPRDAGERRAQVALDVDRERLERRDVEHAAALVLAAAPARTSADRGTRGTRSASCRCRSARGSASSRRARSPASRAPAAESARRTPPRTIARAPDERARADQ